MEVAAVDVEAVRGIFGTFTADKGATNAMMKRALVPLVTASSSLQKLTLLHLSHTVNIGALGTELAHILTDLIHAAHFVAQPYRSEL